jgi:signal transduction histidine kinase
MNPQPFFSQQAIISNGIIEKNLALIFGDSIVLNTRFEIISISDSVLHLLNYQAHELISVSIGKLAQGYDIQASLTIDLQAGFFPEKEYELYTRSGHHLVVGISGFYLGLVSDINGYIIMKVKNLTEIKQVYEQLQYKTMELDHFLYRTSHDLRGPLATIKGLVNIALMEAKDPAREFYMNQIQHFANKLDDTLHNLLHIADSGANEFEHIGLINIDKTGVLLENIIASYDKQVKFKFIVRKLKLDAQINETYILSLLKNIIIHILELQKEHTHPSIYVDLGTDNRFMTIRIRAKGFLANETLIEKLGRRFLSCMDVLQDSRLVRYYAARKIAARLKANIDIRFQSPTEHYSLITIPVSDQ